jgi:hypothetical protein
MSLIPGSDDDLLGSISSGSERNYVASLGRISGKLLSENLLRDGTDLTFRNGGSDPDILYLDVTNMRLGVEGKRSLPSTLSRPSGSLPVYDLDVNDTIHGIRTQVTNLATIDNLTFNANGTIGSVVGPIEIASTDINSIISYAELLSDYLTINDNYIGSISNRDIKLDPNGTGKVVFEGGAHITGDLGVTGNIKVDGNLTGASNIIVGDQPLDTVTVNTDFTQSIIPGTDITYDLGTDNRDSTLGRWRELWTSDLSHVDTMLPYSVIVNNRLQIDGVNNKIDSLVTNDDVLLNPDTGITYIERTKWQDNDITNLNNTPLTLASTNDGYTLFAGTNGFIMPAGDNASRLASPELGTTRWNTQLGYMESWNGTDWVVSTGGGEEVTIPIMEDLSNLWILILG